MIGKINNKLIVSNTISLYIRMLLLMGINLYTSRIILDILGAEDYGIYNLVGTVVVVFSFLRASLTEATQRFLSYEMGRGDKKRLHHVFCTSMNCFAILGIVTFVCAEIMWFLFGDSLNIPEGRKGIASIVFHISLLSLVLGYLQVPYNASVIANEKMKVFAEISVLEAFLKVGLVALLYIIPIDKLVAFTGLMATNTLLILLIYLLYCQRKFYPYCVYTFIWDKKLFRQEFSFTGWNLLGASSGMLSDSGVNILFNMFYGVLLNAAYGIAMQVNTAINNVISGYQTAFTPQLVKLYAKGDLPNMKKLLFQSSKVSFFLFFIVSIPILTQLETLMALWLKEVPEHAVTICQFLLLCTLIDSASAPLYLSINASGKIMKYQISISFSFFFQFLMSYVLLLSGASFIAVLLLRIVTRGILNYIIGLCFVKRNFSLSFSDYAIHCFLPIIKAIFLPLILLILLSQLGWDGNIAYTIISMLLFEACAIPSILLFGLEHEEYKSLVSFVKSKILKQEISV